TALELAKISEPDEHAGLPDREELATETGDGLQLYDERIESLAVDEMKDIALRTEQAAFDGDARITYSEGAEFGAERGQLALADLEGEAALSPLVTIIDDPRLPAQLGSKPFDGEGVRTRRNVVVGAGVFERFLFDSYFARRMGRRTTGNASRTGDSIGIGGGNRIWEAGEADPAAIIASVEDGLYLTDLMGFGINLTTG